MIQEWIIKHPSVVASHIVKDTILVCDKLTGKKNHSSSNLNFSLTKLINQQVQMK